MKYSRFVYIIRRDDKIKAVLTSAKAGRKVLNEMRDNILPPYSPEMDFAKYMVESMDEEKRWHLEKWAVRKTMST